MQVSRRQVLGGAGALSVGALLSACSGFSQPQSSDGSSGETNELRFTTWGSEAEAEGFRRGISAFEEANSGARINLDLVPYEQIFQNIDAQLQAGNAPDLFRVDYGNLGVYSSQDQLLSLADYFDSAEVEAFIPALWRAVEFDGIPYGVPHQTDTSALVYRMDLMEEAGITNIPTSLDSAWTWEEFDQAAATLREFMPNDQYPFAYNWQLAGSVRWLSWLFQAGGRLLGEDLTSSAINSPAGARALDFTKGFFEKNLVPPNSSVKSATYASDAFVSGTTAMLFAGNFILPDLDSRITDFEWGATYLPRDERAACDLGGNALVATKNARNPDLAAAFLRFMVQEEQMTDFVTRASELPTLQSLVGADLEYAVRPDIAPIWVEQATTLTPKDVEQLASPALAEINVALSNQLEAAFVQQQPTDQTLAAIAEGITQATS
ncbi:sugar ABC transporter substrate-binding protein [Arthrobacter tecti]